MKIYTLFLSSLLICHLTFAQNYTPTDAGSNVHFVIKNFGIKTGGDFTGLKGSISFNPAKLADSKFNVSVSATTINTDNKTRDKHLRKTEYFNVEKYPEINITSTKISESTNAGRYFFAGNITIKGITKPIQFGFSASAANNGYLFNGEFEINRRDFGVGGNSMSLGDKLKVTLSIATKK
jgi:polyisoprenoid-binding protein YceI